MDAKTAIQQAQTLGITLTIKDGMINVNGKRTPEVMALLDQMRPLKQAIIDELAAALEFTLNDVDPMPIDPPAPCLVASTRPPLPAEMWRTGLSLTDAWAHWQELKQNYFCTLGHEVAGYYVRCDPRHWRVC